MCLKILARRKSWRVRWLLMLLVLPFGVASLINAIAALLKAIG